MTEHRPLPLATVTELSEMIAKETNMTTYEPLTDTMTAVDQDLAVVPYPVDMDGNPIPPERLKAHAQTHTFEFPSPGAIQPNMRTSHQQRKTTYTEHNETAGTTVTDRPHPTTVPPTANIATSQAMPLENDSLWFSSSGTDSTHLSGDYVAITNDTTPVETDESMPDLEYLSENTTSNTDSTEDVSTSLYSTTSGSASESDSDYAISEDSNSDDSMIEIDSADSGQSDKSSEQDQPRLFQYSDIRHGVTALGHIVNDLTRKLKRWTKSHPVLAEEAKAIQTNVTNLRSAYHLPPAQTTRKPLKPTTPTSSESDDHVLKPRLDRLSYNDRPYGEDSTVYKSTPHREESACPHPNLLWQTILVLHSYLGPVSCAVPPVHELIKI
ncbi:hypothetical protein C8R43DRAFT_942406 [Mycena crocata]|nr:hypothetical protein C8R43DRAFT_942406 [Mycena crocata]